MKHRKIIDLDKDTVKLLQSKADKDNRSLKNYIETMLVKHSKR